MVNTQIDIESIDDKSKVAFFVRHSARFNLKELILKNQVILVIDALRKVSNNLDIYVQLLYNPKSLQVIGEIKDQISDF